MFWESCYSALAVFRRAIATLAGRGMIVRLVRQIAGGEGRTSG